MRADHDDFQPTTQDEVGQLFPFADVPAPSSWRTAASAPIAFPDPELLMKQRERRARDERRRDNIAFIAEQKQAEEIASAFCAGRVEGEKGGYVDGVHTGLWRGAVAGIFAGAALVITFVKLGIAFA